MAENSKNLTFKVQISHIGLAGADLYKIMNTMIMKESENATAIII